MSFGTEYNKLVKIVNENHDLGRHGPEQNMYLDLIREMNKVSDWIEKEVWKTEPVFLKESENGAKGYFPMRNKSGIDFKRISAEVDILEDNIPVRSVLITAEDWKNGTSGRLYFYEDISPEDDLEMNEGSLEYDPERPLAC